MTKKYNPINERSGVHFEDEIATPVLAEEVVPFDGVTLNDGQYAKEEQGEGLRVRVFAPRYLPPNYKLLVSTPDGQSFDVLVPPEGAHFGQEFEATKIPTKPIQHRFSDGLCNCLYNWFWVAWCCPGLAYAALMERLNLTPLGSRATPGSRPTKTFAIVSGLWFLTYVLAHFQRHASMPRIQNQSSPPADWTYQPSPLLPVISLLLIGLTIYFCVIKIKTRMAFRERYRIPGDCCGDCCVSWCCGCCSALQMYRHMKHSGERPIRFDSSVNVEVV